LKALAEKKGTVPNSKFTPLRTPHLCGATHASIESGSRSISTAELKKSQSLSRITETEES
jgi:hypothetical protein